jgi:hypothetical protein
MKNTLYLSIILLASIFMASCSKDDDYFLSESIFIEDPYYPGLPIYSEWGYNTFGAYIDRAPFVSNTTELPVKIYVNSDTLHFILRGLGKRAACRAHLFDTGLFACRVFRSDCARQHHYQPERPWQVSHPENRQQHHPLTLIEGELEFKRVQRLYLDEEPTRTIMSGYFQLKTFLNGEPAAISNGRFDLGIGYGNFFNF